VTNETDAEFAKRWIGSLALPALLWLLYRNRVGWSGFLWLPLLAGPGVLLVVRAIVWANRPPAGTVRVRLSAEAVRQETLVRTAVVADRRLTAGVLVALCVMSGSIMFAERASAGQSATMIVANTSFIAAVIVSCRRRGPRPGRPSWFARIVIRRPVPAGPWADPDHVLFGEAKPGMYRLRCPRDPTFFRPAYVDAHVRLTAGEADAVRERIRTWRRAAAGNDAPVGATIGGVGATTGRPE
jgi:hypothetical protein